MMKLYFASGYVVLGDEVCDAVLEYAQALADVGRSDLVEVPAMSDDETRGSARLLIGPSSDLFAAPAKDRGVHVENVDLDDAEAIAMMRAKIAKLLPVRPVYFQEGDLSDPRHDDHHSGL